jgi:hypothetical protein
LFDVDFEEYKFLNTEEPVVSMDEVKKLYKELGMEI